MLYLNQTTKMTVSTKIYEYKEVRQSTISQKI